MSPKPNIRHRRSPDLNRRVDYVVDLDRDGDHFPDSFIQSLNTSQLKISPIAVTHYEEPGVVALSKAFSVVSEVAPVLDALVLLHEVLVV